MSKRGNSVPLTANRPRRGVGEDTLKLSEVIVAKILEQPLFFCSTLWDEQQSSFSLFVAKCDVPPREVKEQDERPNTHCKGFLDVGTFGMGAEVLVFELCERLHA
jgi:hypothetical protein